jgi:hypothetical protein
MAHGRHAADREARGVAHEIGVGLEDLLADRPRELREIDAPRPGGHHEDRLAAARAAEDEGVAIWATSQPRNSAAAFAVRAAPGKLDDLRVRPALGPRPRARARPPPT